MKALAIDEAVAVYDQVFPLCQGRRCSLRDDFKKIAQRIA
jgi:hypothetical protein